MTCHDVLDHLEHYLLDGITPEAGRHLDACAACRAEWKGLSRMEEALKTLPATLPSPQPLRRFPLLRVAAGLLLIGGIGVALLSRRPDGPALCPIPFTTSDASIRSLARSMMEPPPPTRTQETLLEHLAGARAVFIGRFTHVEPTRPGSDRRKGEVTPLEILSGDLPAGEALELEDNELREHLCGDASDSLRITDGLQGQTALFILRGVSPDPVPGESDEQRAVRKLMRRFNSHTLSLDPGQIEAVRRVLALRKNPARALAGLPGVPGPGQVALPALRIYGDLLKNPEFKDTSWKHGDPVLRNTGFEGLDAYVADPRANALIALADSGTPEAGRRLRAIAGAETLPAPLREHAVQACRRFQVPDPDVEAVLIASLLRYYDPSDPGLVNREAGYRKKPERFVSDEESCFSTDAKEDIEALARVGSGASLDFALEALARTGAWLALHPEERCDEAFQRLFTLLGVLKHQDAQRIQAAAETLQKDLAGILPHQPVVATGLRTLLDPQGRRFIPFVSPLGGDPRPQPAIPLRRAHVAWAEWLRHAQSVFVGEVGAVARVGDSLQGMIAVQEVLRIPPTESTVLRWAKGASGLRGVFVVWHDGETEALAGEGDLQAVRDVLAAMKDPLPALPAAKGDGRSLPEHRTLADLADDVTYEDICWGTPWACPYVMDREANAIAALALWGGDEAGRRLRDLATDAALPTRTREAALRGLRLRAREHKDPAGESLLIASLRQFLDPGVPVRSRREEQCFDEALEEMRALADLGGEAGRRFLSEALVRQVQDIETRPAMLLEETGERELLDALLSAARRDSPLPAVRQLKATLGKLPEVAELKPLRFAVTEALRERGQAPRPPE